MSGYQLILKMDFDVSIGRLTPRVAAAATIALKVEGVRYAIISQVAATAAASTLTFLLALAGTARDKISKRRAAEAARVG